MEKTRDATKNFAPEKSVIDRYFSFLSFASALSLAILFTAPLSAQEKKISTLAQVYRSDATSLHVGVLQDTSSSQLRWCWRDAERCVVLNVAPGPFLKKATRGDVLSAEGRERIYHWWISSQYFCEGDRSEGAALTDLEGQPTAERTARLCREPWDVSIFIVTTTLGVAQGAYLSFNFSTTPVEPVYDVFKITPPNDRLPGLIWLDHKNSGGAGLTLRSETVFAILERSDEVASLVKAGRWTVESGWVEYDAKNRRRCTTISTPLARRLSLGGVVHKTGNIDLNQSYKIDYRWSPTEEAFKEVARKKSSALYTEPHCLF